MVILLLVAPHQATRKRALIIQLRLTHAFVCAALDCRTQDLMALVQQIVPFNMTHNAEPEAVDLLLEVRLPYFLVYNSLYS